MLPTHRLLTLSALIGLIFNQAVFAQQVKSEADSSESEAATTELETIQVSGRRAPAPSTERTNRETIEREMIRDNRDLVRYSPDIGVADQGRHSKGFAIRGVEDNRVGISIDGVALPDSEENSLYKRYGNLNTSRQSIDPELAKRIDVVKGADSFNQGTGNLGGGVNYRTIEASDIVRTGNQAGFLWRSGYASRNEEWTHTAGFGYQGEQAEGVLLYSNRRGHEMKSAGGYTIPEDSNRTREIGSSKQTPDSSKHQNHSFLAKWSWRFNDNHRLGLSLSGQQGKNYIIEDSAVYLSSSWREADDRFKRRTTNVFYEFTPASPWLALLKVDADYQKAETAAYNYEGYRAGVDWSGNPKPALPSDDNIRIFSTDMKRLSFRLDTQPLDVMNTKHSLSFRASAGEKDFHVLHRDRFYLSGNWTPYKESSMMYPVRTQQYHFSLRDQIAFNNPVFSAYWGLRYDHAIVKPQDLNGLACGQCLVPKPADSTFKNWSWILGADAQLNNTWKVGYHIGTGFRIPNASEMYFDFRNNAAGAWMSNPYLKAERSLSQGINIQADHDVGKLSVGLHHTRYKDFLYEQETVERIDNPFYPLYSPDPYRYRPVQQMQNIDKAKIYGIEMTGRLNLDRVLPVSEGWKLFGALGYSRGNLSGDGDLLSIQPLKTVLGLDYEQPEGKWGVFSRLTYFRAKDAEDAKYIHYNTNYNNPQGYTREVRTWPHLNKSAWVFDLYGFYKPTDNLTLRAGIYNLFNRKYHTWDSLRGLNITGGSVNSVGTRPHYKYGGYPGLERYYAPGRNVSLSLEYKF